MATSKPYQSVPRWLRIAGRIAQIAALLGLLVLGVLA